VPTPVAIIKFGLAAAGRLLAGKPAQVVHVGDVASWPLAWVAAVRHPKSRIVLSAHGSDLSYAKRPGWRSKIYAAYLRTGARVLPRARVIANSTWIAQLAEEAGFRNVSKIPLATSLDHPASLATDNGALLFAGRIAPAKGLAFVVEQVLPLLPSEIRLRVAGTVWDQNEARMLKSDRVDYLGSLSSEALAAEYASAMCTLVPSLGPEGFGLTAVEAAVVGGVVIASNHSGLAEAVAPGIGYLVEAGEAKAWAQRIVEVAGWTTKQRASFVNKASAKAQQLYNWDRVVRETLSAYEDDPA